MMAVPCHCVRLQTAQMAIYPHSFGGEDFGWIFTIELKLVT